MQSGQAVRVNCVLLGSTVLQVACRPFVVTTGQNERRSTLSVDGFDIGTELLDQDFNVVDSATANCFEDSTIEHRLTFGITVPTTTGEL
jgi:hypothetical protein